MRITKALVIAGLLAAQLSSTVVYAFTSADSGLIDTATSAKLVDANANTLAAFLGGRVIAPIVGLIGLALFVLIIYAGVLWMTAQGDPKKVEKAQHIMRDAVVGAVVLVSAYALANFVITSLNPGG